MPKTQWDHLADNLLTVVTMRAVDVRPYAYAIWCRIEGGSPFVNDIVCRRWSEDGRFIHWMLDTHNFIKHEPDEMVEVVQLEDHYRPSDYDTEHESFLAKRPTIS